MRGRFAPSPTGRLHVGNLRTALAAWLSARSQGGSFVVRMEDLDPVTASREHEVQQLADLRTLGIDHDGEVIRQSERFEIYRDAIARLDRSGAVYRCYCTRREIREAVSAPHGLLHPDGAYPGTCRELSDARRRELEREGRRAALRLRTSGEQVLFDDVVAGPTAGIVDDVVLQRNDGVPAYNLAVVIDDELQGVTEVVRGDDLLSSTPRQIHLQHLLGYRTPVYAHVPLVVGPDGQRLAKRHGAVTLADTGAPGWLLGVLAASLGLHDSCDTGDTGDAGDEPRHEAGDEPGHEPVGPVSANDLLARFRWSAVPRTPWTFDPQHSTG